MEFLEYYRIIRDRVWIVIAGAAVAAIIVVIFSIMPPSEYTGRGRILVREEAFMIMRRSGDSVTPASMGRDSWYTLFNVLASDSVLYRSAQEAGITDPRVVDDLEPIEGQQESRSSVARITAAAPTREQTLRLTTAAMDVLLQAWDEFRLGTIDQIEQDLETVLAQTEDALKPLENRMDEYMSAEEPGTPPERLAALEERVSLLESEVQAAEIEVKLSQDRVESLRQLERGQASLPLEQQQYGSLMAGELRTMHQQLDEMEDQLASMLEHRTEQHPAVKALKEKIAEQKADIEALRRGEPTASSAPSPLEAQILQAELAVADAQHRIEVLQAEALDQKAKLPIYRSRAEEYAEFADEYEELVAKRDSLLTELDELAAERRRLRETEDIEILDEAVLLPTGKTIGKTLTLFLAGVMGGALIGALAVLVLHYIDVTFKNAYEAERLSQRRVLASIPRTDILMEPIVQEETEAAAETDEAGGAEGES